MVSKRQKCDGSDWDLISYVISSRYRIAVLGRLDEGPLTPTRIADRSDFRLAHISRAIQQLRRRHLVELLVSEEQRKGRVYGITDRGTLTWSTIQSENLC
ncbi:ArsR family transcriptional regulator [Halomarina salina]|uniref:ArsR family transcriptional regulator n=1 Tax=Halomarina salina TaxID=1872699 RepID=A0ABD5RIY2_9EURY|nr:winged helix-turn-helix domain-containing protein [Halomarina salina]